MDNTTLTVTLRLNPEHNLAVVSRSDGKTLDKHKFHNRVVTSPAGPFEFDFDIPEGIDHDDVSVRVTTPFSGGRLGVSASSEELDYSRQADLSTSELPLQHHSQGS